MAANANMQTWDKISQNCAEEAKHSAEEANVKLLRTKKDSEEAIAKFKLEAEPAKAFLKKHKEADFKKN